MPTIERKDGLPILTRTRLLQRIKGALHRGNVFISAPAGYGKSTLLHSLISEVPDCYYLALTLADADLNILRARLLPILPKAAVVVLDDIHHLVDASEALTWLVEHQQATRPRWVFGGRLIPPPIFGANGIVPLGLLLDSNDLAFRLAESKALLRNLEEPVLKEWHEHTQGWPLALALLAWQSTNHVTVAATAATGEELFNYLARSVFAAIPSELVEFIQLSALPLRFNDELLAAILDHSLSEVFALRKEVQRRNLFLEASDELGWFKYHDFVRQYLCRQVDPSLRTAVATRLVAWFEKADDLHMLIESALDGNLFERAAELMISQANRISFDFGWYQSYKRWTFALPESIQAQYPLVLAHLGMAVAYHLRALDEGLSYLNRASDLAERHSEPPILAEVKLTLVGVYNHWGQAKQALPILQEIVNQPTLPLGLQALAGLRLASAYALLFQFRDANRTYSGLESIVGKLESAHYRDGYRASIRHNRALLISALRGDFVQQEESLRQNLLFDQGKPARLEGTYVGFCVLHESLGAWDALAEDLRQIKVVRLQQDSETGGEQAAYQMNAKWEMFFWAAFYIGKDDFAVAQPLSHNFSINVSDPEAVAAGHWLQTWSLRCQKHYAECVTFVDQLPADLSDAARFYRAATVFERATAAFFTGRDDWRAGIEPHLRFHMQIGSKHYLLRWRILLALACYKDCRQIKADEPGVKTEWRKHVSFVLCTLKRYGYERLLIQREPELAAHFWTLCLAEAIQTDAAVAVLTELGRSDLLFELLNHPFPAVRKRAIEVIAAIGDEATIPKLAKILTFEQDASVHAASEAALDQLEALPPPTIRVTMLGEFVVQRGNQLITADDWQRPGARRLFQYFALNQGKPLLRDQILEELWPNSDPTAARGSFKSVYSLLRIAIEPYLRPKSQSRYLQVDQETYTLNPRRSPAILYCDIDEFAKIVRAVLKEADAHEVRPLTTDFIAALENWKPLAPELSYEAWALETRERLQNLYVEGCLYAADALLDIDKPIDAALWAERVIAVAPWSEEAWEQLMRAQARQGNRTIALKSYENAVIVLKREFDAPPSSKLAWLAKRLRADEEI